MIDKKYADNYKLSLNAMHLLLQKTGIDYWAGWIKIDIMLAEKLEVKHHLDAYGGMGSFNDIVICRENNHKVTKEQEPWLNSLFGILKFLCSSYANNTDPLPILDDSRLYLFPKTLIGWECSQCGHCLITKQ